MPGCWEPVSAASPYRCRCGGALLSLALMRYNQAAGGFVRMQAKLNRAREAPLRDADGTPLFTPRTGRAPVADARTATGLPVWEMLYSRRHEASERRDQLERQQQEESRRSRTAPRVNKRSETLLRGLQQRRFQQVFEFLDQQQRGALDLLETVLSDTPEFRTLSSEIRQDLEAAALLMCVARGLCDQVGEAGGEGGQRAWLMHAHTVLAERCTLGEAVETLVGEEEFMELMGRVVEEQPRVPPRSYLLPDLRMNTGETDLTFQPVINDRSVEMALQRWPDRAGPVYEHLHDHAKAVQVRGAVRGLACMRCTHVLQRNAEHGPVAGLPSSLQPHSALRARMAQQLLPFLAHDPGCLICSNVARERGGAPSPVQICDMRVTRQHAYMASHAPIQANSRV